MSVIEEVAEAVRRGDVLVVSGAGMSTDSGLPDYRGMGSTPKAPIDFDMFVSDPVWYRWLWYRNEATWRMLDALEPTLGHFALAALEQEGLLLGVATQNIDRLDARAGVVSLWELHEDMTRLCACSAGARCCARRFLCGSVSSTRGSRRSRI